VLDTSMTLADGRVLAYTDLGVSSSPLVLYFHGAPTSRLDLVGLEDSLTELDVRVVSADRPGYGGSSPQPGRSWEDWPADTAALASHFGVERFSVLGFSSGGPYAVACASLLPDHVAGAGVVCGVGDFGWRGAWDGYLEDEVALMRIGDEVRAVVWCEEHYGAEGRGFLEGGGLGELAPADRGALEDEAVATSFTTTVIEAFRQGVGGYAQDMVVQGRAWSFDPGAVVAPTWILHGEADTVVPIAHARHTAGLIPGASLSTWPEHGHLSILAEVPQLITDLVAPLR
jgi:pimeloyl-ACP methyl ester carboxylesterase